ncbi:hypothetical protein F4678DRAFT_486863 [Xylaria arbuscula]|nr:hypothetical protein F4678DRAFT_486863 [Xylaria arbuscula]
MPNKTDESLWKVIRRLSIWELSRKYSASGRTKFRRAFQRVVNKVAKITATEEDCYCPRVLELRRPVRSWAELFNEAEGRSPRSRSPLPTPPKPRPTPPKPRPPLPTPRCAKPKPRPEVPFPTDTYQPIRSLAGATCILTTSRVDTPHIRRDFPSIAPPRFQSRYPEHHRDLVEAIRGFRELGFNACDVAHLFAKDNNTKEIGRHTALYNEYPNMAKAIRVFQKVGFKPLEARLALTKDPTDSAALNLLVQARLGLSALGLGARRILLGLLKWGPMDPKLIF